MSVQSIGQSVVGASKADAATSSLATNYESFLTLLVAQVQNQDPLEPMESSQFVDQLATLTQVEQTVQMNSQMENLRSQLALNAALSETGMIGREVTGPSDTVQFDGDKAVFSYELAADAATVQAQIRDASGNLIAVIDGLSITGKTLHEVEWDGTDTVGNKVAAGQYHLSIAAVDAEGGAGSYNSYTNATVLAVEYSDSSTYLQLSNGNRINSGEIVRAR